MTWSSRFFIFCLDLYIWGVQGDPPPKIQWPLVAKNLNSISKIGRTTSLALMTKSTAVIFCDNRMYSHSARAASVLSTQSCFSSFEKQYQVFNGLEGLKVPLLVSTNHINNEKHVQHWFLALRPYLCSTSLNPIEKFKSSILHLNRSLHHWILISICIQLGIPILLRVNLGERSCKKSKPYLCHM